MPLFELTDELVFPPPALSEPGGLLAVGGDLSPERLVLAYSKGIFPWYNPGDPILWWSPEPRVVFLPGGLHISRRLRRTLRQGTFAFTLDTAFDDVVRACATAGDRAREGTWITPEMELAYCELHERGVAHSVEVWVGGELAGGLYGVSLGACFFGESMFSYVSDASKAAMAALTARLEAWDFLFLDAQTPNPHLFRMGAVEVPRARFLELLRRGLERETRRGPWTFEGAPPPGGGLQQD
jgi:leucyl/phenylalanyl-tRNA--protein transferase